MSPISALALRFPSDELEREFRTEYARSAVRPARATTGLIIALYIGYVGLDLWTGTVTTNLPIRVAVVLIMSVILALTWHPVFVRHHSLILSIGALVAAGGMLAMMALEPQHEAAFYPGIGIAIIGTFTLYRIRFPVALIDSFVMLAAYEVMARIFPFESLFVATFFLVTCILIGAFAGWNIEHYARRTFLARKGLEEERERSERLLLNVLPQPIAERLKTDPAPIADRYAEASILFADVVGFTAMSVGMEPEDLVTFLNELFTEFDRIAERHGLEKIKTIGDAYMAVCGVPVPCPDHLERIANAALEMRGTVMAGNDRAGAGDGSRVAAGAAGVISGVAAKARGGIADGLAVTGTGNPGAAASAGGQPPAAIRIGIDTGPVVAGVIGEKKFIYDLWGAPVTMASRMETHGEAGAIHVTEAVWQRLQGRYTFEPRGRVDVKGRGEMETWWLVGTADASGGQELPGGAR